jgi:putative endonuclease
MYYVYVLSNPAGRHYIGMTDDMARRLGQHNAGESKWTAGKGPWSLSWQSQPMSLGEARKLENLMKRQKGGVGLERLKQLNGS